jgi:hypothetical protein
MSDRPLRPQKCQSNDGRSFRPRAKLLAWTAHESGSLKGFADIQFPSGLQIAGICVHVAGSRAWASPPGRLWIEHGELARDESGKPRYAQFIRFANHGVRARWPDAVLAAVNEHDPAILANAEGPPLLPLDEREDVA